MSGPRCWQPARGAWAHPAHRAQRTVRLPEHTKALENVVLGAFNTARPCRSKLNRPPSDAALALAAELLGDGGADPVIDLDIYRRVTEEGAS